MPTRRFFFYPMPHQTPEEVEEWAAKNGMRVKALERGPDGLVRGICEVECDQEDKSAEDSEAK